FGPPPAGGGPTGWFVRSGQLGKDQHVPVHHRALGRFGHRRQDGAALYLLGAGAAGLHRIADGDRSTAAGASLPVDQIRLAVVDRDVVTVLVGVVASAIAGSVVGRDRVSGRRGQGKKGHGAKERGCVLEAGQVAGA